MNTDMEEREEIIVRLSHDEMEAYLTLPPLALDGSYTKAEVMEALAAKKVKIGIDEEQIDRMLSEKCYGREEIVARGTPAVEGVDGFFQYNFNTEFNSKPKVRPDGSVDYWSIHAIEVVEEGQVIAVYHDPIDGSHGMTVTGKLVMTKRGRPLPALTGKGFERSEDNHIYTASLTGKIEFNNNRIQILPVYEIYGNVDLKTGNIDFRGDVLVHGNVISGTSIKATGSITIDGTAEACGLEAGKDIILRGGFLGAYRGTIRGKGNVFAKFLEYADVDVEGFIEADSALDCNISCKDKIYMKGKRAAIVGGDVYGVRGVEAYCFGNENELKTKVKAGTLKETLQEIERTKTKIKEITELINKISSGLKKFDDLAIEKNVDLKNDERRVALLRTRITKQAELSAEKEHLEYLKSITERAQGAKVRALREVHPGVTISINDNKVRVKELQQAVEYVLHEDKVVMFSIGEELVV
jgi:uncharacterized protein (DUF342 family)